MEDSIHVCPHCRTQVPHGASVCTGCQAEVEYGASKQVLVGVVVVALLVGLWVGTAVNATLGWIVFFVVAVGGLVAAFKLFANRVSFTRIYRTR